MNRRTGLALTLGAWAAGTLFMWFVATQNFATVDRILAAPPPAFQSMTASLDAAQAHEVLRYEASELNRLYFDRWGYAQVLLSLIAVALAWKGGRRLRAGVLVATVIAVGLQFYVVPETIRIGRSIDFQPRQTESPRQAEFWRLHNTYTGLDMLKFLIVAGCGFALLRERD